MTRQLNDNNNKQREDEKKKKEKKNYLQLLKSTFKITFILTHTVWGVNKIIKIINEKKKK